ncbi:MAG: helix-turn-helix domain-containing protein [Deltaproteobacteria bacterium]|nr:helix-turn-helix domain-containing protein [Deltaproteobacteria bacterium]
METIYQVADLARFLGLRRETIYRKVKSGEIPSIRIGRSLRFPESLIKKWLEGKAQEPSERWRASLMRFVELLKTEWGDDLIGVVLFGSFATGKERSDSDLDLIIISKRFPKSRLERQGVIFDLAKKISRPFAHKLSPVPLTPEEANEIKPIYLGLLKKHQTLHDRNFFEQVLQKTSDWLKSSGAKEEVAEEGQNFWVFPKEMVS